MQAGGKSAATAPTSRIGIRLAGVRPPARTPSTLGAIRAILSNAVALWPQEVYERDLFRLRVLGREALMVMHPDLIRGVLVDQADAFERSDTMRRALSPALGEAILTSDGARWRWQRRAAAPIFRHERIQGFVPEMLAAAERTGDAWLAQPGQERDIAHEMMRTTFDVIVATMLSGGGGIDAARVERGLTDYIAATGWLIMFALLGVPGWVPYPGRRRADQGRDYLRGELLRLARERRASGAAGHDLLSLLLAASDPETGQAMTDRDLADNLLTFITAGHETTAQGLAWTFYLLSLHPQVEARAVAEIETVCGGGLIAPAHIAKLDYLRQVFQEAIRLYPPAAIITRKAVRDTQIGSERVTAGTPVTVPTYAVHRHRALWPDPDVFDPDRFAPEAVKARHRYAYLPFGAGPRICIGMGFAMTEAVAILARLLRATKLTLRAGYVPEPALRVTLRPAGGMPMRVERRAP